MYWIVELRYEQNIWKPRMNKLNETGPLFHGDSFCGFRCCLDVRKGRRPRAIGRMIWYMVWIRLCHFLAGVTNQSNAVTNNGVTRKRVTKKFNRFKKKKKKKGRWVVDLDSVNVTRIPVTVDFMFSSFACFRRLTCQTFPCYFFYLFLHLSSEYKIYSI